MRWTAATGEAAAWVAAARDLDAGDIRRLMSQAVQACLGAAGKAEGVQWLADNGGMYRALDTQAHADRLGLECMRRRREAPSPTA